MHKNARYITKCNSCESVHSLRVCVWVRVSLLMAHIWLRQTPASLGLRCWCVCASVCVNFHATGTLPGWAHGQNPSLWQAPAHKQEAHNEAEWHRKTAGGKLTPWVRECSQHHYTKWIKTRATGRATWNKRQRLNKQHHPRERGNEMYDPVFTLHWNCGRMVA